MSGPGAPTPARPEPSPGPDVPLTDVPVPDHLLVPLLEAAGDVLRGLAAADVPASLRPLQGFDRRGLLHGPAPRQLRAALGSEPGFRDEVATRFVARPEVKELLDRWQAAAASTIAADAAARGDLPLLASALWIARPDGWQYGLGAVASADAEHRRRRGAAQATKAQERADAANEEALRRSEAARLEAVAELARVQEELRSERGARRAREQEAEAGTQAAQRQADGLRAQLEQARAAEAQAQARLAREAQRSARLDGELAAVKAELAAAQQAAEQPVSHLAPEEARLLRAAADAARRGLDALDALAGKVGAEPDASRRAAPGPATPVPRTVPGPRAGRAPAPAPGPPNREPPLARRAGPPLPAGMLADSPAGIRAMLQRGVVLVVDGYNVTQRGWPDAVPADQRERLAVRAGELHARTGCESTLVFDGDGTVLVPAFRRPGVRVIFSAAGEEADEVVVREVAALPKRVPVVVASSDAWVREHAEAQGAVVVAADTLLRLFRR